MASINKINDYMTKTKGPVNVHFTLDYTEEEIPLLKNAKFYIEDFNGLGKALPTGSYERGYTVDIKAVDLRTAEQAELRRRIYCDLGSTNFYSNPFAVAYIGTEEKETPKVRITGVTNITENGDYTLKFNIEGRITAPNINSISLKIDSSDEFIPISPVKEISNNIVNYTYNGTGLLGGTHIGELKFKDSDSEEFYSEKFKIEIPSSGAFDIDFETVNVEYVRANGDYKISFSLLNMLSPSDVKFDYDLNGMPIGALNAIYMGNNKFLYYGTGLKSKDTTFTITLTPVKGPIKVSNEITLTVPEEVLSSMKEEFITKNSLYNSSYSQLISSIQDLLRNPTTLDTAKVDIEAKYNNYITRTNDLRTSIHNAVESIAENKTNETKKELDKEVLDLNNALGRLDNTMKDVFNDGVLTEAEKLNIRENLQRVSIENIDVNKQYDSLLSKFNFLDLNFALNGTIPPDISGKTPETYPDKKWYLDLYNNFRRAFDVYETKYRSLVSVIDFILSKEGIIDSSDKNSLGRAFDEYYLAITEYSKQASLAIEGIARNESENNATYVTTFRAEYVRTNTENSSKLEALTQKDTEIESKYSELKQTADGFSLEVRNMKNDISKNSTKVTATSNRLEAVVQDYKDGELTYVRLKPYQIMQGLKDGTYVVTDKFGHTIWNGYLACDKLTTPPGHSPVIYLFGDKNKNCGIDATANFNWGTGDHIRFKYDDSNYYRQGQDNSTIFFSGNPVINFENKYWSALSSWQGWMGRTDVGIRFNKKSGYLRVDVVSNAGTFREIARQTFYSNKYAFTVDGKVNSLIKSANTLSSASMPLFAESGGQENPTNPLSVTDNTYIDDVNSLSIKAENLTSDFYTTPKDEDLTAQAPGDTPADDTNIALNSEKLKLVLNENTPQYLIDINDKGEKTVNLMSLSCMTVLSTQRNNERIKSLEQKVLELTNEINTLKGGTK